MSGLTAQGSIEILRLEEILAEVDAELRATLGDDIRLEGDSVLGQLRAAPAIQIATLWEALGEVATALDPDQAQGELLDGIVALSGVTPRKAALPSTGTVTLTGTPGTTIPAGTRLRGAASGVVVETVQALTLSGASGSVGVRALATGPLEVPAADLTVIVTPVSGLASATNAAALVPGRHVESNAELRARREASLQGTGGGTLAGIRAALLDVAEVQQAVVIQNTTLTALPSGQPGKSVRAVLWPDTADPVVEADIARVLAGASGARAGIEVWGEDASATVSLSSGQDIDIAWDYAAAVGVYVSVALTVSADAPSGLATSVKSAIEACLLAPRIGEDVRLLRLQSITAGVSESILAAAITLGTSASPVGTADITIDDDQIAQVASSSAIVVTIP